VPTPIPTTPVAIRSQRRDGGGCKAGTMSREALRPCLRWYWGYVWLYGEPWAISSPH